MIFFMFQKVIFLSVVIFIYYYYLTTYMLIKSRFLLHSHTVILLEWTFRKWVILILPSSIVIGIHRNPKQKEVLKSCEGFDIIQFILSDRHLDRAWQSLRHILDKVKQWHFHITSNTFMWPKYMQGLKRAILAIFQTGLGWRCTVSMALKNPLQDFKNYFCIWVPMNS